MCGGRICQSADKLLRIVSVVMNPRKPKFDWIKKVLADPVVGPSERATETPLRVVCGPGNRSTDDQLGQPGDGVQLVCLSWQLMRLSVGHLGAQDHRVAELSETSTNI
jgi:hypothetical protein